MKHHIIEFHILNLLAIIDLQFQDRHLKYVDIKADDVAIWHYWSFKGENEFLLTAIISEYSWACVKWKYLKF